MKIFNHLFIALSVLVIFTACTSTTSSENGTNSAETSKTIWTANKETQTGMEAIKVALEAFDAAPDYKILQTSVAEQTTFIINNCDMEGEDHEQLHTVLLPILEGMRSLKEEDLSKEDQDKAVLLMRTNNALYFERFKTK